MSSNRVLPCLLLACGGFAHSAIFENSSHEMAAGNFGVAWLNGSDISYNTGSSRTSTLLTGVNATKIVGADVNGDGSDELVYVSGGSLYYHDFSSGSTSGGFGGAIVDITAGTFNPGDVHDTVVLTTTNQLYQFSGITNGFGGLGGAAVEISSGNYNTANGVDEFLAINAGNQPYIYTPGTGYTGPVGGAAYNSAVSGNLSATPGDEFWLSYGGGNALYMTQNPLGAQNNVAAGGSATAANLLGTGNLDRGLDEGFVLGGGANNIIYQWKEGIGYSLAFANGDTANNNGWKSFIFADLDGNGVDEFYGFKAASPNDLWAFETGLVGFTLVIPEPSRALLLLGGGFGLFFRRRR